MFKHTKQDVKEKMPLSKNIGAYTTKSLGYFFQEGRRELERDDRERT